LGEGAPPLGASVPSGEYLLTLCALAKWWRKTTGIMGTKVTVT